MRRGLPPPSRTLPGFAKSFQVFGTRLFFRESDREVVPLENSCRSTSFIADQLTQMGYSCDGLILNRCLPSAVVNAAAESKHPTTKDFILERAANQTALATRLAQDLKKLFPALVVQTMEEFQSDLGSVDGMINFSRKF